MAVEMDFVVDLVEYLRAELVADGFADAADRTKVDDDNIGILYFNVRVRRIAARPRAVEFSKIYSGTVPAGQELAIEGLLTKVRQGDDLRPHQSRKLVRGKLQAHDGMLNDWGINHLHPDAGGGDHVLMCHVRPDVLFAIGFWPHGNWTLKAIVDALLDAWPEPFRRFQVRHGSASPLSDDERAQARAANLSVLLDGPDGTAYLPIGGGLTTAGSNMSATTEYDRLVYQVVEIEERVERQRESLGFAATSQLRLEFEDATPVAVLEPSTGRRLQLSTQ